MIQQAEHRQKLVTQSCCTMSIGQFAERPSVQYIFQDFCYGGGVMNK